MIRYNKVGLRIITRRIPNSVLVSDITDTNIRTPGGYNFDTEPVAKSPGRGGGPVWAQRGDPFLASRYTMRGRGGGDEGRGVMSNFRAKSAIPMGKH